MKKLIYALILTFLFVATQPVTCELKAQTFAFTGTNSTLDTVVNTGTYYLTSPALVGNDYSLGKYNIAYTAVNKTGTTTITAVLQGSNNGTQWENLYLTSGTNGKLCDTVSMSGTSTHIWTVSPAVNGTNAGRRLYLRIKQIGGATGTTQVSATVTPFK